MKTRRGVKPVLTSDPTTSASAADDALFMDAIQLLGTKITSKESSAPRMAGAVLGERAKAAGYSAARATTAASRGPAPSSVSADDAALFEAAIAGLDGAPPKAPPPPTPLPAREPAPIRLDLEIRKDLDGAAFAAALDELEAPPATVAPLETPTPRPARPDVIGEKQFRALLDKNRMRVDLDLDLHGKTALAAIDAVRDFMREAIAANVRVVRIVHGKGMHSAGEPVLRDLVRNLLRHELADAIIVTATPPARLGGDGATVCLLKTRAGT